MTQVSDASLLFAAARSRDGEAIGEFVRRYGQLLYSVALRVISAPDRAEELARKFAMEIAIDPDRVRGEPAVWLHDTITRRALDLEPQSNVERNDPAEEPEWDEIKHVVDRTMLKLSKRHRHMIIQHYFQRHAQDELAEMLQVNQPVVAQRLRKALEALRVKLVAANAGCSLGQLMMLLARHGASDAPAGWVEHVSADAQRKLANSPERKRRTGWLGLLMVWMIVMGVIFAVASSYNGPNRTNAATPGTMPSGFERNTGNR